jgi:hypothetical protein
LINRIYTTVNQVGSGLKFKLFKLVGGNYALKTESVVLTPGLGLQAIILDPPFVCEPTDVIGVWLYGNANPALRTQIGYANGGAAYTYRYADGDILGIDAFATQVASRILHVGPYGFLPSIVFVGDSIWEGHNGPHFYHTHWHSALGGVGGTITSEIGYWLRRMCPGLEYQNWSYGSQTWSWINVNGVAQAYTNFGLRPKIWILGCGVNDVSTGRTWAQVQADLDAIRARIVVGDIWVSEILPWTAGTDANAATLRTFNTNIAAWCLANNAHLLPIHDEMGQIRAATGYKDDLLADYDFDGVHITEKGVVAMAALLKKYLGVYYG